MLGPPMKFLQDLHLADVLVLDDFLTTPIDAATAHQLLNILAEREHRGSTIVTSQFTPDEWCQMRVFGTGVLGTRYCRVPSSWYRAEGCVGPDGLQFQGGITASRLHR
ncbi:ATP-binding protein [Corynebacterium axilliensis]|uniref:ATP-binding protein n=1 Tax=Corynebacterium sp. YSMAA5_1_F9 TaxID=3383591 RepID=UPI0038CFAD58